MCSSHLNMSQNTSSPRSQTITISSLLTVHLPTESSHCILIHRAKLLIHPGKDWLRNTGSPSSRITKAEFRNEKEIEAVSFSHFNIKH
ncbi:uncharacterized protein LOC143029166 isoform X3 [Oratosquilla oratoria]|uniref:uncharacterized protein LOC143029166 isoform X3 n=1 Tax=Oratosquilla oratoria TaxID=337810 RepID=UPI003F75DB93